MKAEFNGLHAALLVFGLAGLSVVLFGDPQGIRAHTLEDGPVENMTAALYALGVLASLIALARGNHRLFAGLWLVLCLLFLGEETSWFQRQLGYSVPEVERLSGQGEFNLHNLYFWHGRKYVDASGQFQFHFSNLIGAQSVFRIGFFLYFLALPTALAFAPLRRLARRFDYPFMAAGFIAAAWAVIVVSLGCALITVPPVKDSIAEYRELFYALVIFLHTLGFLHVRRRLGTGTTPAAAE